MRTIKIRTNPDGPWIPVGLLDGERPNMVEVSADDGSQWVRFEDVHPADQVALTFERQARQRYIWVPPEDRDQPG